MNKILLVTRPKYDDGTEYLSCYAQLVLNEAENKGIIKKDFEGKNANREEVLKFIHKKNPKLLFINGHGDKNCLYGHEDKEIFSPKDSEILKKKIIYARACNAGENFGKEIVKEGGSFIGYKYSFSFWMNEKWSTKPLNDNIAKLYLEPSNEVVISLIKGKKVSESDNKSKKMMVENMKKILKMEEKKEPGAMGMLQVLWTNFEGQVVYGEDLIF